MTLWPQINTKDTGHSSWANQVQDALGSGYPAQNADYTVFINSSDGKYYARNGLDGSIDFSAYTDFGALMNAIDASYGTTGGHTHVKRGTYSGTTKWLIAKSHRQITADIGTIIQSSLMPCFEINGGTLDTADSLQNISVKNIIFEYTGSVVAGDFLYTHGLQSDYIYQGCISFENINIRSTQVTTPTDLTFVGWHVKDFVGVTVTNCNAKYFGTGIKFNGGLLQSDLLTASQLQASYCKTGVSFLGGLNRVVLIAPKLMFCSAYGISAGNHPELFTLINPQFESLSGATGLSVGDSWTIIENARFSVCAIGIDFGFTGDVGAHMKISGAWFSDCTRGIICKGALTAEHVWFSGTYSTKIELEGAGAKLSAKYIFDHTTGNPQVLTENSGTSSGTGSQQTIAHGCSFTPTYDQVFLSERTTGGALAKQTAPPDATNIYITATTDKDYNWRVSLNP